MRILIALLIALPAIANASTTYYIADCGAGSGIGCVAGNDAAAGTAPATPWRTAAKLQSAFSAAQPGDQILLARCGAWDNVTLTLRNAYSAANATQLAAMDANRLVVGAYTPTWCTGGTKPLLNGTSVAGDMLLNFTAGSSGTKDGGYTIRDIALKGKGTLQTGGISLFRWPQGVTFDNVTVSDFGGGGITCGGQAAYGWPDRVVVRNSTIKNVGQLGVGFFGCPNLVIESNLFDGNGFDNVLTPINHNHQAYISGTDANNGSVTTGDIIRNNTFINSSVGSDGRCQSAVIVGHDVASDWVISGNVITQAAGTNSGGCWGISMSPGNGGYVEVMDRIRIDSNVLVNVGNVGINFASCRTCEISNNLLVWTTPDLGGVLGIRGFRTPITPITAGTKWTVRNNSIYFAFSADVSTGITLTGDGTGHTVTSNLVYFGAGTKVASSCFETNLPTSAFVSWDYNACYNASSWAVGTTTLTAWQSAKGFDTHSVSVDPKLVALPTVANPMMLLQASSPLIAKADPARATKRDLSGCLRAMPAAIGAFDYFATTCGTKAPISATGFR